MIRFSVFVTSLLLSSIAFAAFPDVDKDHPYAEAIEFVEGARIVSGYPDGTFQPDKTINRAEFAKMFVEWRWQKTQIDACNKRVYTLQDVPQELWFAPYVCVLMSDSLVRGYSDGTYRPDQTINFAEASKILAKNSLPSAMIDEPNPWYKNYVWYLGDLNAIPLQIQSFDQPITRGLMAEILYRMNLAANDMSPKPSLTYRQLAQEEDSTTESSHSTAQYIPYTDEAYALAIESGKPFLLNFSASWCPSCMALDKEIQERLDTLSPGAQILKVNYDAATDLKEQYRVTQQTTGVFFDAFGDYTETVPNLTFKDIQERL